MKQWDDVTGPGVVQYSYLFHLKICVASHRWMWPSDCLLHHVHLEVGGSFPHFEVHTWVLSLGNGRSFSGFYTTRQKRQQRSFIPVNWEGRSVVLTVAFYRAYRCRFHVLPSPSSSLCASRILQSRGVAVHFATWSYDNWTENSTARNYAPCEVSQIILSSLVVRFTSCYVWSTMYFPVIISYFSFPLFSSTSPTTSTTTKDQIRTATAIPYQQHEVPEKDRPSTVFSLFFSLSPSSCLDRGQDRDRDRDRYPNTLFQVPCLKPEAARRPEDWRWWGSLPFQHYLPIAVEPSPSMKYGQLKYTR